jgi:hypothetical protein
MNTQVQIIDKESGQILYLAPIGELDLAYQKARDFEAMGLDIELITPSLTVSLISTLGASESEILEYKESLESELASHNENFGDEFGCAICPTTKK